MTIETTKKYLLNAFADAENKVVALSGKWGTGKSHLWRDVQEASTHEAIKGAIYVSLFGLASMDQVKLKLVQSAVPIAAKKPQLFETTKKTIGAMTKALEGLHKGFAPIGALGEFALLLTPTILKNKVIVLDDIERKHKNLSVDEILGFIDEFSQRNGTRFVLILNTDELSDRAFWETFREKVIDLELKLHTTPEEAFGIALSLTSSPYAASIKAAVSECGLTNIRIIQKIIRSINQILEKQDGMSDALLARVIPSTVLLSAIHFKGIEDGPPTEFVLSTGSTESWSKYTNSETQEKQESDEAKREGNWKNLLSRLGILGCDEYELLVVDYLESGLPHTDDISKTIENYKKEERSMVAREMVHKFIDDSFWNHHLTEAELMDQSRTLKSYAPLLDPYNLTNVCEIIAKLADGKNTSDAMINAWIDEFTNKKMDSTDDDFPLNRKVHPKIQEVLNARKANERAGISLYSVCEYVASHGGSGTRHRMVMASATPEAFETLIRTLEIHKLKVLLREMMEILTSKSNYCNEFQFAADQFSVACRNIVNSENSVRLGKLIRAIFETQKVSNLLESVANASTAVSTN